MLPTTPILFILLSLCPAAGGKRPVAFDVCLGLGGYYQHGSFPVVVSFSSATGPARSARATAFLEAIDKCSGDASPLRSYSTRFEIPAGEVKSAIHLPVILSPSSDRITVSISDEESGEELLRREFTPRPFQRRAALILSSDPSRFAALGGLKDDLKVVPIRPEELPDNPHLYAGFSVLIVDDVPFRSLSPAAREAMLDAPGESLKLVFTERSIAANADDPDFLSLWRLRRKGRFSIRDPDHLLSFLRLKDVALEPVEGTEIELDEEQVYLREDGHPLVGSWVVGLGWMILITFDPSGLTAVPAEKTHEVRQRIWEWLMQDAYPGDALEWNTTATIPAAARLDRLKKYFFAYLGAAALLVLGPLNYLLLKRFERREFILVAIPLAVGLLGCLPWLIGRIARGNSPTLKTVSVEFGKARETRAVSRRGLGLLAADGREHRLSANAANVFPVDHLQVENLYHEDVGGEPIAVEFVPGRTTIGGVRTPPATMRFFRLDRFIRYPGALEHRLSLDRRGVYLEGDLTNRLGFDLRDAGVVFHHRRLSLGDIPAGGTADFRLPTGISLPSARPPGGGAGYEDNPFASFLWEGGPYTREDLAILSGVFKCFHHLFRYPVLFARRPPEEEILSVNRPRSRRERADFVFFALSPRLRTLKIPYGIATRSLRREEENLFYSGAYPGNDDEIFVNFTLPVHAPDPVEAEELTVCLHAEAADALPLLALQAFDWRNETWVEVGSVREKQVEIPLPDPGRFVFFPGGKIALKIKFEWGEERQRGSLRIPVLDVSFRGRLRDG